MSLVSLPSDTSCELNVSGHNGHALGVDGAQVGVFKQADQVGLRNLLQRQHCGCLEAQVDFEVLRDLTHQALEGQLADEQLGGLLVAANLTEGDGPWPVPVRLQHAPTLRPFLHVPNVI